MVPPCFQMVPAFLVQLLVQTTCAACSVCSYVVQHSTTRWSMLSISKSLFLLHSLYCTLYESTTSSKQFHNCGTKTKTEWSCSYGSHSTLTLHITIREKKKSRKLHVTISLKLKETKTGKTEKTVWFQSAS